VHNPRLKPRQGGEKVKVSIFFIKNSFGGGGGEDDMCESL